MEKEKRAAIIGAVERSYEKWIKMTPKKNGEVRLKTTHGKGLTVTRQTNTSALHEAISVTNYTGVNVRVNFQNNPMLLPAKGIVIEMSQWGEHKYRGFIEISKGTRHSTVLEKLRELLNAGFDRCPDPVPSNLNIQPIHFNNF